MATAHIGEVVKHSANRLRLQFITHVEVLNKIDGVVQEIEDPIASGTELAAIRAGDLFELHGSVSVDRYDSLEAMVTRVLADCIRMAIEFNLAYPLKYKAYGVEADA
jgi:hypothetical protein